MRILKKNYLNYFCKRLKAFLMDFLLLPDISSNVNDLTIVYHKENATYLSQTLKVINNVVSFFFFFTQALKRRRFGKIVTVEISFSLPSSHNPFLILFLYFL